MKLDMAFIMLQYLFVLIISFATSRAAVARRLGNIYDESETEDNSVHLKLKMAAPAPAPSYTGSLNHYLPSVPVHHFARHGLCRHEKGRNNFYKGLKSKQCDLTEEFIASLVTDLCKQRGSFLDKWVREIFDIDDDGFISHFERRFYENDDVDTKR